MAATEQRDEYISLAPLFGENSMEAWTRTLLEEHGLDCQAEIEGRGGTMVFCGRPPQVDLVGHVCEACWERREEVRHYRLTLTTR